MEESTELITEVIDNAKDAYVYAQEKGLEKPIVQAAKNFTNWFGGLFTRKAHKERVKKMEELKASEKDYALLQAELEALAEEKESLETEFKQQLQTLKTEVEKVDDKAALQIAKSKLKNVNFGNVNTGGGDFILGDNNQRSPK